MNTLQFSNSQKAWEYINKMFFIEPERVMKMGGARYGGQLVGYDFNIEILKPRVKPSFDFGNMFGYRDAKWKGLVNNYIDIEALRLLKDEVDTKIKKNSRSYNLNMPFYNNHGHGKKCLTSLVCSKRQQDPKPVMIATLRSSEMTKRLLMDLLLIQRIGEYLYGSYKNFSIKLWIVNLYQNPEAFTMYNNHENLYELWKTKKPGELDKWSDKIIGILDKYLTCELDEITMKVHKRCVRQLQRPNGIPLSGDRPMLAKDLIIKNL